MDPSNLLSGFGGAILGSVLGALIGASLGFLGAGKLDRDREARMSKGALRAVVTELVTNKVIADRLEANKSTAASGFSRSAWETHGALIGIHLPPNEQFKVIAAYALLPLAQDAMQRIERSDGKASLDDRASIGALSKGCASAIQLLRPRAFSGPELAELDEIESG